MGAIARLEQAPGVMSAADAIGLLKEMRDDLRLLIESTGGERLGGVLQVASAAGGTRLEVESPPIPGDVSAPVCR